MTKRSRLIPLALPVVTLALFAGCSPNPNTAVQMGDRTVSEVAITNSAKGCSQVLDEMGLSSQFTDGDVRRNVVSWQASGLIADELASQYGVSIKDSDKRVALASLQNGPQFAKNETCGEALDGRLKLLALAQEEGADKVAHDAAAEDIVVNPRYGSWNGSQQLVNGTGSMSLPSGS
ncbi:hypothetical protein [Propionibacterium sp.]|uniref:hypothetical protein n=1 Tax=Propionibacterium sp. TaxID=1977903 RepID=UPI0039EA766A